MKPDIQDSPQRLNTFLLKIDINKGDRIKSATVIKVKNITISVHCHWSKKFIIIEIYLPRLS